MKIISSAEVENRGWLYTVMLEPGVYVDVKRTVNGLCYVMDCGDGYMAFDDNGNTFDYKFDTDDVVGFVEANRNDL